jgi:GT2 family glycosyltransferase
MKKEKSKVLLGVITNRGFLPTYFVKSLFELFDYTRHNGIKVDIRTFSAVEVQQMRNRCCRHAIDNGYDYVFMLDDDMMYPRDSITELIKHNKDFVVGSATQRNFPYFPTQYKKFLKDNLKAESNRVFIKKEDKELKEIGGSGVVGALIKVDCLKKLEMPYFKVEYKNKGFDIIGSDIYFCNKLVASGVKLFLDPLINYDHGILAFYNSFGMNLL